MDSSSSGTIVSDELDLYAGIVAGDTIFIPPVFAQLSSHSPGPAPQFGGLYIVVTHVSDDEMIVTRDPRMDTSEKIASMALVSVENDYYNGRAVYQIATSADSVLDVDQQVMPMIGKPGPDTGTYALESVNGILTWTP